MVQPIGSSPGFSNQEGQVVAAAKDLHATTQLFRTTLITLLQSPARIDEVHYLNELSQVVQKLYANSKRAINLG